MKQLATLDTTRFHIEEDFGFHQQVAGLAESLLTQEADKALAASYLAALATFDDALKQSVKNSQTELVTACDEHFDRRYVAIAAYIRAILAHPDSNVADVAKEAYAIWEKYGNITAKPYNEEYGAAYNFLQDLAEMDKERLTLSGLHEWYIDLEDAYNRFIAARQQQVEEESKKVTGIIKDSRTACDAAWRTFRQQVNAMVIVYGEDNYAVFIDNVNVIIASAKARLKARATRAENAKEDAAAEEQ